MRLTPDHRQSTLGAVVPRVVRAVAIPIMALACSRGVTTTTTTTVPAPAPSEPTDVSRPIAPPLVPPPADTRPCAGVALEDPVTVIVEGASASLSGQEVIADGFMMRWIKPETGVSEHLTSARISTVGAATGASVGVGAQVPIGGDRYCVVRIEYGRSGPGSVSLRKLAL